MIEELIVAAQSNTQIASISTDEDVVRFYEPLLDVQHDNRRLGDTDFRELRR